MSDNTQLNIGTGGDLIASDNVAGVKYQRIKLTLGADGAADGDVSATLPMPVRVTGSSSVVSTANSTTTPLAASATYTGSWEDVLPYVQVHLTLAFRPAAIPYGDGSTAKGSLFFEFSDDATNSDISVPSVIRSGIFIPYTLVVIKRYYRVKYINDGGAAAIAALGLTETAGTATLQTQFRLTSLLLPSATKELGRTMDQSVSGSDPANLVRASILGKDALTGAFANIAAITTSNTGATFASLPVVSAARPDQIPGRTNVFILVDQGAVDALIYTVTAGKTLYITDVFLQARNSLTSGSSRINIRDGLTVAGAIRLPIMVDEAAVGVTSSTTVAIAYISPLRFTAGVFYDYVSGTTTAVGTMKGYEE